MATIHDVATLAGVSATTAKRAIRSPQLLAPQTLERVQQAIEALHYEPDQIASALRGGHTKTIGLMIGDILEPSFAMLTRSIGQQVRQKGYSLLLADNEYNSALERDMLKMFYGNRVRGLILRSAYIPSNYDYLLRLQARGSAIVELEYVQRGSPFSHVMLDNTQAAFDGVTYLVELGHKRIAYVGKASSADNTEERHEGFVAACKHYGLELSKQLMGTVESYNEDEAYTVVRRLLELHKPPTAIFAFNGTCTLAVYRAIQHQNLHIPKDISLLGFDNYSWTSLVTPPLDVLEQPLNDMASHAVELVFEQMKSGKPLARHVRLPAKLIQRGSCQAPKVA